MISMALAPEFPPQRLMYMLDAKFSQKHRYPCTCCAYFCKDCDNRQVICQTCKIHSNKHQGHKILQVSLSFFIKGDYFFSKIIYFTCGFLLLFDISYIYPFVVNYSQIVYLYSKQKELHARRVN